MEPEEESVNFIMVGAEEDSYCFTTRTEFQGRGPVILIPVTRTILPLVSQQEQLLLSHWLICLCHEWSVTLVVTMDTRVTRHATLSQEMSQERSLSSSLHLPNVTPRPVTPQPPA